MLPAEAFQKFLVLLPFAFPTPAPTPDPGNEHWSYDAPEEWGGQCQTGQRQSPIHLRSSSSITAAIPPLRFGNYEIPLAGPLTLVNNGHSVHLDIPATRNGNTAFITGGMMKGRYEAVSVHWHWGSPNSKGSEHVINGRRFDVEMHIVHKNVRYATVDEATQHRDGLAVLGVMFKIADVPDRFYPGLDKIFNKLPLVSNYEAETNLNGQLTVGQLLGDLNVKRFYTYSGSLTTPLCAEAVTWTVFPEPLPIAYSQISKFWDIDGDDNEVLLDNFRPLQPRNNRLVYYRPGGNSINFLPQFKSLAN